MIFESHRLAYSWGTKNDAQNIWHAHRHVLDEDCLSTWRYGAVALWRCGAAHGGDPMPLQVTSLLVEFV